MRKSIFGKLSDVPLDGPGAMSQTVSVVLSGTSVPDEIDIDNQVCSMSWKSGVDR